MIKTDYFFHGFSHSLSHQWSPERPTRVLGLLTWGERLHDTTIEQITIGSEDQMVEPMPALYFVATMRLDELKLDHGPIVSMGDYVFESARSDKPVRCIPLILRAFMPGLSFDISLSGPECTVVLVCGEVQ